MQKVTHFIANPLKHERQLGKLCFFHPNSSMLFAMQIYTKVHVFLIHSSSESSISSLLLAIQIWSLLIKVPVYSPHTCRITLSQCLFSLTVALETRLQEKDTRLPLTTVTRKFWGAVISSIVSLSMQEQFSVIFIARSHSQLFDNNLMDDSLNRGILSQLRLRTVIWV